MNIKKIEKRYFPDGAPESKKGTDEWSQFVEKRFYQMVVPRNVWYQRVRRTFGLWDVFQDWLLDGEHFDKAVRFPTLRDVANAIRNEILRVPPEATIEALMGEHPERAQALDFRIKEIKNNIYEKRVQEECLNDMLFYGIGYRFVNFYEIFRTKDGEVIKDYCDVGSERLDPSNVFWDQNGRYIYDNKRKDMKRDCVVKFTYPYSAFLELYDNNPEFINVRAVQPLSGQPMAGDQNWPTQRQSEEKSYNYDWVNVYWYFNQEDGFQAVVANNITIKMPFDLPRHGRIPIVNYVFEKRRDTFYGNSLAELIAPHIYAQDTIFNLELMGLKLDLMPATMIDSSMGYNPKVHKLAPRAIWPMNVPQGKNIQNMVYPMVRAKRDTNGFYAMNNHIESMMTITSGQDRRALYLSPGELATQTAAKNQSMQRSVNALVYSNEIEAEGQLTELMVELAKEYAGKKVQIKRKGKLIDSYRKVKVEGYDVFQSQNAAPMFVPAPGKESYFEFNEEAADVNVNVSVKSMRTKMMLQEQKVARLTQGIPVITNFINAGAQVDPDLLKKLDWNGIVEQWAEANDLDMNRTLKSLHTKVYDRVKLEHKAIMANIDIKVPEDETMEESERHLEEHLKLRYVYENGKRSSRETTIWTDVMTKVQKAIWATHVNDTIENIKNKLQEEVNKPTEETGAASPGESQLPKQTIPAQLKPGETGQAPQSDIASKTLLARV